MSRVGKFQLSRSNRWGDKPCQMRCTLSRIPRPLSAPGLPRSPISGRKGTTEYHSTKWPMLSRGMREVYISVPKLTRCETVQGLFR